MNKVRVTSLQIKLIRAISAYALIPMLACAQQQRMDTTRTYPIPEVIISQHYQTREIRSAAPIQTLSKEQLNNLNALQLSDAVKHLAGVTVKDYGGIGGMKTVSLRGIGAEHTAVGYDGITISDTQTGRIDIGRFSLENVEQLTLSNGQSDQIFQPARFFASAGVLNIQTLTPKFQEGKNTNASATIKTGSWGLFNPTLLLDKKINEHWALAINGNWMTADGRYPYTLYYGNETDSTSRQKRKNTETKTLRTEVSLFANLSETEQWKLKAYYYQTSRGLPGATTLYYDHASQHLQDKNTFLQSQYKKEISRWWVFQTSAKWSWSYLRYLDPDYKSIEEKTENNYYQQEYYLSASLLYRAFDKLSFSLSSDGSINKMNADLNNFTPPRRYSWLTAAAAKYADQRITATTSLLGTIVNEDTRFGACAGNHRKLKPYIAFTFKPLESEELRVRAFCKDIFRLPAFNDLYYSETGNINLHPENTLQYNVGITYEKKVNNLIPYISLTADAYYNKVTDKIIAIPTKNIFVWSMVNLGEVEIKGIDITTHISLQPWEKTGISLSGNYTYQRALDITDADGKTYKHQIAYTPRVSGSGQASLNTPLIKLSYTFLFSGKRYILGQNTPENRMSGYTDHSLSANKTFKLGKLSASVNVEALNILDKNYEIVRYFPMPGRSIRAGIKVNY